MANRVSPAQLERLLDKIEKNPKMALSSCNGPHEQQYIMELWDNLALTLNAMGNGFARSGEKWKRYWIHMKSTAKTRAAELNVDIMDIQRHCSIDGLKPRELRVLAIIAKESTPEYKNRNADKATVDTEDTYARSAQHSVDPSYLRVYSAADPLSSHVTLEPSAPSYEAGDIHIKMSPRSPASSLATSASTAAEQPRARYSARRRRRDDEDRYRRPREMMGRVPWYVDIETKRIRAKTRTAAALTRIANAVEKQTELTAQLLEHLKNKL